MVRSIVTWVMFQMGFRIPSLSAGNVLPYWAEGTLQMWLRSRILAEEITSDHLASPKVTKGAFVRGFHREYRRWEIAETRHINLKISKDLCCWPWTWKGTWAKERKHPSGVKHEKDTDSPKGSQLSTHLDCRHVFLLESSDNQNSTIITCIVISHSNFIVFTVTFTPAAVR